MNRKLGILLGVLGALLVLVSVGKLISSQSPKEGMLKIASNPVGSVFLDNKKIGKTPLDYKVKSGEYTIQIVPDGGSPETASWQGKVQVSPNTLTYINRELSDTDLLGAGETLSLEKISSKLSEISVNTTPDGTSVLLDDEDKGVSPTSLAGVTPGDHTITLASPGFLTRTIKAKTTAGYKLTIAAQLALSPTSSSLVQQEASGAAISNDIPILASGTPAASGNLPIPKPYIVVKETPTGFLRVRVEPSTSASEAAKIKPGETYPLLESENGWVNIKYDGVHTGWVSGQYVDTVE